MSDEPVDRDDDEEDEPVTLDVDDSVMGSSSTET